MTNFMLQRWFTVSCLIGTLACGGSKPPPSAIGLARVPPNTKASEGEACDATSVSVLVPHSGVTEQVETEVSGKVDLPCAEVWIVLHPVGTVDYYVQPKPTVQRNGDWLTTVQIGEAGASAGKTFELLALVNPKEVLQPMTRLNDWPVAAARSDVVFITRASTPQPPARTESDAGPPEQSHNDRECEVAVTAPEDGEKVATRVLVQATTSEACEAESVWMVVHPLSVSNYYVQPRASEKKGLWRSNIHVGRPGMDIGERFELEVIVNPKEKLGEGDVLGYWPDGDGHSGIIEVVKGRP